MFLGLRTVVYPVSDIGAATAWWVKVLGKDPYFEEPFYVGFDVGGYELGLDPDGDLAVGPITYWGVRDADRALDKLVEWGAQVRDEVRDVGGGIRLAVATDPLGNPVGVIENPSFRAAEVPEAGSSLF